MSRVTQEEIERADLSLTPRDRGRSATSYGLPAFLDALAPLTGHQVDRVLDVGCGYGGLSRIAGDRLGATELHGVDIDSDVVEEAATKNVTVQICDVEERPLPYEDDYFDFVMSLGMIDYLPTFDGVLSEIRRVLKPGGFALLSIPNLGSWNNRLALLLGYQPRDVEISDRRVVGAFPYYRDRTPTGHIHTPTLKAFVELMDIHGFDRRRVSGASWTTRDVFGPLAFLDRLMANRPSLAKRFFYLGSKSDRVVDESTAGWWRGRETLRREAAPDTATEAHT